MPDSLYQHRFNDLPGISSSESRRYKKRAWRVVRRELPQWRKWATLPEPVYNDQGERVVTEAEAAEQLENAWMKKIGQRKRIAEIEYMYTFIQEYTSLDTPAVDAIVAELAKRVQVYTNVDLANYLKKATEWMSATIRDHPWVAVTEQLHPYGLVSAAAAAGRKRPLKSSEWALRLAWDHMPTPPQCVADVGDKAGLAEMVRAGIRHFGMFDDAAYSGKQKAGQVFSEVLFALKDAVRPPPASVPASASLYGRVLKTVQQSAKTLKHAIRGPPPSSPTDERITLYLAIPFLTDAAIAEFTRRAKGTEQLKPGFPIQRGDTLEYQFVGGHRVLVWTGGVRMPSLIDVLRSLPSVPKLPPNGNPDRDPAKLLHKILLDGAGSLCIFEHKVPDGMSLPWMFGETFQRAMKDHYRHAPPYSPPVPRPDVAAPSPAPRAFECFAEAAPAGGAASAKRKHKYNGRWYTIRTGARGGKYIVADKKKIYVR